MLYRVSEQCVQCVSGLYVLVNTEVTIHYERGPGLVNGNLAQVAWFCVYQVQLYVQCMNGYAFDLITKSASLCTTHVLM